MLSARCREPRPSQFSPRLQVRVISTSNIYLFIYLFITSQSSRSVPLAKGLRPWERECECERTNHSGLPDSGSAL